MVKEVISPAAPAADERRSDGSAYANSALPAAMATYCFPLTASS